MYVRPDFEPVRLTRGACQHVECSWLRCEASKPAIHQSPFSRRALASKLPVKALSNEPVL